jgi:hypothetical protein
MGSIMFHPCKSQLDLPSSHGRLESIPEVEASGSEAPRIKAAGREKTSKGDYGDINGGLMGYNGI